MEQKKNELFGIVLFVLPAFILYLLSSLIEPLQLAFRDYPWTPYAAYSLALLVGWYLRKSSGVIKDHEWQRTKAMKDLKKHYEKEEKGVWNKDISMSTELSIEAQSAMQGSIGKLVTERVTEEIDRDSETDSDAIKMLVDANHVAKASRRVSGDENFDEEHIDSTIGAIRKQSSMDRLFDWVAKKFRNKDAAALRMESKQAALSARSVENPVAVSNLVDVHQKNEVARLQESVEQSIGSTASVPIEKAPNQQNASVMQPVSTPASQSIEEMAALSATPSIQSNIQQAAPSSFAVRRCQCGHGNPPEERFCVNCGSEL